MAWRLNEMVSRGVIDNVWIAAFSAAAQITRAVPRWAL